MLTQNSPTNVSRRLFVWMTGSSETVSDAFDTSEAKKKFNFTP